MTTKRKKRAVHADADADVDGADETPERERERPALDRLTDLRMDITDDQSAVARLLDIMIDEAGGDSDAVHADITEGRQSDSARAEGDEDHDHDLGQRFDDTTAGSPAV